MSGRRPKQKERCGRDWGRRSDGGRLGHALRCQDGAVLGSGHQMLPFWLVLHHVCPDESNTPLSKKNKTKKLTMFKVSILRSNFTNVFFWDCNPPRNDKSPFFSSLAYVYFQTNTFVMSQRVRNQTSVPPFTTLFQKCVKSIGFCWNRTVSLWFVWLFCFLSPLNGSQPQVVRTAKSQSRRLRGEGEGKRRLKLHCQTETASPCSSAGAGRIQMSFHAKD